MAGSYEDSVQGDEEDEETVYPGIMPSMFLLLMDRHAVRQCGARTCYHARTHCQSTLASSMAIIIAKIAQTVSAT